MDPSSQFIVPTIIDVPELIVTNEDIDYGAAQDGEAGFFAALVGARLLPASAKLQFLSTALCYIIGLGNLWHFPYLCYKYAGGAFLCAYSVVLLVVGVPLVLMELAFGQYANEGPITIWRISPAFEGIGYAMCLISAMISLYYNFLNSWLLHYLFGSLTFGALPWTSCDNPWNGPHCFLNSDESSVGARPNSSLAQRMAAQCNTTLAATTANSGAGGNVTQQDSILLVPGNCTLNNASAFSFDKIINTTNEVSLPANDYFHNNVLQLGFFNGGSNGAAGSSNATTTSTTTTLNSDNEDHLFDANWSQAFCLVLVWLLVFTVLFKQVRPITSTPAIMATLVMPYLSLFALLVRALTLPGASLGVSAYLTTQWDRLQNIDIWSDAIGQVFFSLGPCWGGIIALANMNKFHNNFHADTMLIVGVNYVTSLAAGLMTFATLGYMSSYSGIAFQEVADSGLGLIFQVYPEALAQLPMANVQSVVFFAMLLFLGLTSQLTVLETVSSTIIDTWPHKLRYRRPLVLALLCGSMLLVSLFACLVAGARSNLWLLQCVMDAFAGSLTGMFIGLLELVALAWVYGMENFLQDLDDMISVHRPLFPSRAYWYFMWRYLTPSALFAVLLCFCLTDCPPPLSYRGHEAPAWSTRLGLAMTGLAVGIVPACALIRLLLVPGSGSLLDRISYLCRPSEDWAPSSYVSGPKLINRHQVFSAAGDDYDAASSSSPRAGRHGSAGSGAYTDDDDHRPGYCSTTYACSRRAGRGSTSDEAFGGGNAGCGGDDDSRDDEDLKVVDGKASYIIPEEDDDDDDDDDDQPAEEGVGLISTSETNV